MYFFDKARYNGIRTNPLNKNAGSTKSKTAIAEHGV